MKKKLNSFCIFFVVVLYSLFALGSGSKKEDSNAAKSSTGITSLDLLKNDTVDLNVGGKDWSYFIVKGNDKFSLNDIEFISTSPDVATFEYDSTALTTYVYYNIKALAPGETKVYVQTKDGNVKSDEIIVRVSGSATIEENNSASDTSEQSVDNENDVDPIIVTVDDLIDALNSNALKASTTYEGKYVEMTGRVSTIDSSGDYFSLGLLNDEYSFDTVLCNINEDQIDTVSNFTTGQKVTVIGTITEVGEIMGYSLDVDTIK